MMPSQVLMTADSVGGVWTYALDLSRALSARGTAVSLATMGAPLQADQWAQARQIEGLEVFESNYRLEWMQDSWADVEAAGDWLLDLENRLEPDVIHLNGFVHGALEWSAPSVVVAHSCVFSWWNAVHKEDPPRSWHLYQQAVRAGLQGATCAVAVSAFMREALAKHYEYSHASVIHNGAAPADYTRGEKQPLLLASGRIWDSAKNLGSLQSLKFDWPLYIAGETEHPDGGNSALEGPQNLGRLNRAQMSEWLARAAIYISPARYEPFGLSVLEASLSGCALVLSDIPSFRELWNGAAVFVSPDEPEEFAAEANDLARDGRRRQELAERARKRALGFGMDRMVDAYLGLYETASSRNIEARKAGAPCA